MKKREGESVRRNLVDRVKQTAWTLHIKWKRMLRLANNRLQSIFGREAVTSDELKYILEIDSLRRQNRNLDLRNKKLEELNHEWADRLNAAAHDLRLPISRNKGLTQLLQMTPLTEEQKEIVKYLDKVNESGHKLIDELLNIHSTEQEQPVVVNLKQLIHARLETFFNDHAARKGIRINTAIEDHLEISTDPFVLSRILDNLVSNALKFSEPKSQIFIKVLSVEDAAYISVQDQGPGINETDQKNLFKQFQKLSAKPTAGESSTGLGLSIVKRLVDQLGGEISVRSDLGKGTEFIIRLNTEISEDILHTEEQISVLVP